VVFAKLTSKGQVTVPKEVREKLRLKAGDTLAYELKGNTAHIHKVEPFDAAWHNALSATLEEWNSPEDNEAFRDL